MADAPAAILFDFDGVLLDSEYASNVLLAEHLTGLGHPHTPEEAMHHYMGLSGADFVAAIETRTGIPLGPDFLPGWKAREGQLVARGIAAVAGAAAFIHALPAGLPRAICSSSGTGWLRSHSRAMGVLEAFEPHIYSGREHVSRGKPAPDLYCFAADRLGVAIERCVIIEDSPVGVTGALASGARVIGFSGGGHCGPDHAGRLQALGVTEVAASFAEVAAMLGW